MKFQYAFERLSVWQSARETSKMIYTVTRSFPKEEIFGLKSQIRRAIVSVSSNLAEGSGRTTANAQAHYYEIAFSSGLEVANLLIIVHDLEFINDEQYAALREKIESITFQINKLIKQIKEK
jgi:four helix bundle protein